LLLTFSAFSQEKLSYQDGVIKQGEEVLSLEELSVLVNGADITYTNDFSTRQFKFNAEKTKRLRLAANNKGDARALNAKAAAGIAAGIAADIILIPLGVTVLTLNFLSPLDQSAGASARGRARERAMVVAAAMLGIGLAVKADSSAAKIGTSESFGQRAEESIHKAVTLYNASLLEAQ
jgi:hypothetical protein